METQIHPGNRMLSQKTYEATAQKETLKDEQQSPLSVGEENKSKHIFPGWQQFLSQQV